MEGYFVHLRLRFLDVVDSYEGRMFVEIFAKYFRLITCLYVGYFGLVHMEPPGMEHLQQYGHDLLPRHCFDTEINQDIYISTIDLA